jgi:hypothetical protein
MFRNYIDPQEARDVLRLYKEDLMRTGKLADAVKIAGRCHDSMTLDNRLYLMLSTPSMTPERNPSWEDKEETDE